MSSRSHSARQASGERIFHACNDHASIVGTENVRRIGRHTEHHSVQSVLDGKQDWTLSRIHGTKATLVRSTK